MFLSLCTSSRKYQQKKYRLSLTVHILNNRQEILTVMDGAHIFCWEAAQTKTSVIFSKMCVLSFSSANFYTAMAQENG